MMAALERAAPARLGVAFCSPDVRGGAAHPRHVWSFIQMSAEQTGCSMADRSGAADQHGQLQRGTSTQEWSEVDQLHINIFNTKHSRGHEACRIQI